MGISTKTITEPFFRIAARAPFNIAPEQGAKLADEIFGTRGWEIRSSETRANFYAVPADKAIYLSYAGLASLWCIAYSAYHIADVASVARRALRDKGHVHIDITQECISRHIQQHIEYAEALVRADEDWPSDLVPPQPSPAFDTPEGRVNNVFYGALSWILLHEIAHIHHGDTNLLPAELLVRQEYRADAFATRWILDCAGNGLQREFRVLMITVALTWLFIHERTVGVGHDHPRTILRFREAAEIFRMGDRSAGLENAAYILKAVLDPTTPAPSHDTPKDAFEWIVSRLEALFGV